MLWFTDRQLYKIFLSLKTRYKKFWVVWFSRLEHDRFWVSERRLQSFIKALRKDKKLVKVWQVKGNNNPYKCNLYKLSQEFIAFLESVKDFVKNQFEFVQYTPDDVLEYVKTFAKKKSMQYKFEINWTWYIVADRWKWRGKIYDTVNRRIVSLITIQKLYY